MKKSITTKLFVITFTVFILFLSLNFLFQTAFFEKFYLNKKINNLNKNMNQFTLQYASDMSDSEGTFKLMNNFEIQNNSKVIILDQGGTFKFIQKGNTNSNSSAMAEINKVVKEWTSSSEKLKELKDRKVPLTYVTQEDLSGNKNIVCISPITSNGELSSIIFSVGSLQPISEASSVINELYIYIYIGAIIILFVLSFVYSNMITKPLKNLNSSAMKIAKFDFSEKIKVNSDDEMGNLGKTLNFLSDNLDSALKELKTSNEQLKEDIEKERKLEKLRKEFVAGISHELKTPISVIKGYAEGLKDNVAQGEDRDYYTDVIIDESDRMTKLVSDMLDLAQLESGSFRLKMETFFIDDFMDAILKKYSSLFEEKEIKLVKNIDKNIEVKGDRFRIEQVIVNYITNAIKNTKEQGEIKVILEDKETYALIKVENEGGNIEKAEMENIWDKFYKVDKSRNRTEGGTGLGLAICKNILLLHESKFGVENIENGVRFYFTLNKI